MSRPLAVVQPEPAQSITDAERIAHDQASAALKAARVNLKTAISELRPIAKSPLFGNGLHKGLCGAVDQCEQGDDALEKLETKLHEHFHGSGS